MKKTKADDESTLTSQYVSLVLILSVSKQHTQFSYISVGTAARRTAHTV